MSRTLPSWFGCLTGPLVVLGAFGLALIATMLLEDVWNVYRPWTTLLGILFFLFVFSEVLRMPERYETWRWNREYDLSHPEREPTGAIMPTEKPQRSISVESLARSLAREAFTPCVRGYFALAKRRPPERVLQVPDLEVLGFATLTLVILERYLECNPEDEVSDLVPVRAFGALHEAFPERAAIFEESQALYDSFWSYKIIRYEDSILDMVVERWGERFSAEPVMDGSALHGFLYGLTAVRASIATLHVI